MTTTQTTLHPIDYPETWPELNAHWRGVLARQQADRHLDDLARAIRQARCACGDRATVDRYVAGSAHDQPVRWAECANRTHRGQALGPAIPVAEWAAVARRVRALIGE